MTRPKVDRFATRWSFGEQETITMILSALLQQAGGEIILTEQQLGDVTDKIIIDVNEQGGFVTVTLIPDWVQVEAEPDAFPLNATASGGALIPDAVWDDLLKGLSPISQAAPKSKWWRPPLAHPTPPPADKG